MSAVNSKGAVLSARLKAAREMAGLSQGQVAKKLGLHRPAVSEMEAGRRRVSVDELAQLAELYKVEVSWLANGEVETSLDEMRVDLAARELAKLNDEDLERVMSLLSVLKRQ